MNEINNFQQIKECIYKDEHYSVRDNGAIMRHQREGERLRKNDNVWTFGTPNEKNGYMEFSGKRVHRIVAYAFHGNPPSDQHVVDHIDTNRRNNRPENLRWLTKLENILNNPYTRSRIVFHCGSVEAFLNNPSILKQNALEPNISWMRTVSKEEAAICLKWLDKWRNEDNMEPKTTSNSSIGISDWIFNTNPSFKIKQSTNKNLDSQNQNKSYEQLKAIIVKSQKEQLEIKDSLTLGAKQEHWKIPTEFPLCPQTHTISPLKDYLSNLIEGQTFCKNDIYHSTIIEADISCDKSHIAVLTSANGATNYALSEIRYNNNFYIHKSIRTFFTKEGAKKYYTLSLGKKWNGGDVLEDFC